MKKSAASKALRNDAGSPVRQAVPDDVNDLRQYPNKWRPGSLRPFIPSHAFTGRDQNAPGKYLASAKPGRSPVNSEQGCWAPPKGFGKGGA